MLDTFRHLRIEIGADDAHLSTAIDLGRVLADTVILANSPEAYLTEFVSYRLQNAYEWLEDLHTSFPEHASDAVKGSPPALAAMGSKYRRRSAFRAR